VRRVLAPRDATNERLRTGREHVAEPRRRRRDRAGERDGAGQSAGGADGRANVLDGRCGKPSQLEPVGRYDIRERDEFLAHRRRRCLVHVEALRVVAEDGIAQHERPRPHGAHAQDRLGREAHVLRARQVPGQHRLDVGEPAIRLQRIEHPGEHVGADPLAGAAQVAGMVRQNHRRERDHVVPEPLQNRHDRR
jgi:hypothetical protein